MQWRNRIGTLVNRLIYWREVRRRRPARPSDRVAIFKPDRLGDFVLALGAIHRIVDSVGAERCVLLLSRPARELAAREFPGVERVEVPELSSRLWKTRHDLARLRGHPVFREGVGRLVCLRHHRFPHEDLVCSAVPVGYSFGLPATRLGESTEGAFRRRLRFDRGVDRFAADEAQCEELSRHAAVVTALLGQTVAVADLLPVLRVARPVAVEPGITVSPFGAADIRRIPETLLIAAATEAAHGGLALRFAVPPGESPRFEALAAGLRRAVPAASIVLQSTPTLADLLALVAASRLVLTAETATAHLATAMDLSCLTVVGGGHWGTFFPWHRSRRQSWITQEVPCRGCNWRCEWPEPRCLTEIGTEKFIAVLRAALAATAEGGAPTALSAP